MGMDHRGIVLVDPGWNLHLACLDHSRRGGAPNLSLAALPPCPRTGDRGLHQGLEPGGRSTSRFPLVHVVPLVGLRGLHPAAPVSSKTVLRSPNRGRRAPGREFAPAPPRGLFPSGTHMGVASFVSPETCTGFPHSLSREISCTHSNWLAGSAGKLPASWQLSMAGGGSRPRFHGGSSLF